MKQPSSPRSSVLTHKIFWSGVVIFMVGILGLGYDFWQNWNRPVETLLPAETEFFVEISAEKIPTDSSAEFLEMLEAGTLNDFSIFIKALISNQNYAWLASPRITLGALPGKQIFLAAKIRSQKQTLDFLQAAFLLERERFIAKEDANKKRIFVPMVSSGLAVAFFENWVVLASSKDTLETFGSPTDNLWQSETWLQTIDSKLPDAVFRGFFRSHFLGKTADTTGNKQVLTEALAQILPLGVFSISTEGDQVKIRSIIQTSQSDLFPRKSSASAVIPELAQLVEQDSLFFINGFDLYQNYRQTHALLEKLHPEFALIFRGIFQTEAEAIFGERFDFSADFLAKTHGQYSLVLDFSDDLIPLPRGALITGFGKADTAQKLKDFHETLRYSQRKLSTKIQTVELANGSKKEAITVADPQALVIEKHPTDNGEFYTAFFPDLKKTIAYGFTKNYFVFSTEPPLVEKIFRGNFVPLTQNKPFRDFVLFNHNEAESYGVINTKKLQQMIAKISLIDNENPAWPKAITPSFSRLFFSRASQADQLEWNFFLE